MFEIARDIIDAHIQFTTYWQFVIALDTTIAIIGIVLFYTVYMTIRKQLRIRDRKGMNEWIGLMMRAKKCKVTPHGDPCRFLITFRRRSWLFWRDIFVFQKLYYQPPKDIEKLVIKCPKCKAPIEILSDERPLNVECSECGTGGRLTSENTWAKLS